MYRLANGNMPSSVKIVEKSLSNNARYDEMQKGRMQWLVQPKNQMTRKTGEASDQGTKVIEL